MQKNSSVLEVRDLRTQFSTKRGIVKAVDGVNFELHKGECLCLVGESGCGKSITALSILRLIDIPPGNIAGGKILFNNLDLAVIPLKELMNIRGKEIAMVFQDAQSAFNPVFSIGEQIAEQIKLHLKLSERESKEKVKEKLEALGMPDAELAMNRYPHQLSGGMRQRAMIAMGLSCNPKVIIADEPTTAVDVTIRAQILDIFKNLKSKQQASFLFITHDFGVVSEIGDRAVVMYAGRDVETAGVTEIIGNAAHPYTKGLLKCLPDLADHSGPLLSIPGMTPDPINLPPGCTFHPRCPDVMDICQHEIPLSKSIAQGHAVSCHLYR